MTKDQTAMNVSGGVAVGGLALCCFLLASCLLALQFSAPAADSVGPSAAPRYHLSFSDYEPRAGEVGERTILFSVADAETNFANGKETLSNSVQFVELKGRETVLQWDVGNGLTKVELVVSNFTEVDGAHTNELLRPGCRLEGKSVAGESFFRGLNTPLPYKVQRELADRYNINPRQLNPFRQTRFPSSVVVGETWPLAKPMNEEATSILGLSYAAGAKTTGQLVGITNVFGLECFHVRHVVVSTNTPEFLPRMLGASGLPLQMDVQVNLTADLIAPLNMTNRIMVQRHRMVITGGTNLKLGGQVQRTSQGTRSLLMVDEFRPTFEP